MIHCRIQNQYFELCYSRSRIITTKCTALLSILDDTFDVYGTLDERRLLTIAIQRPLSPIAHFLLAKYISHYS
jgi:Terpene synthase family, metal binding domain